MDRIEELNQRILELEKELKELKDERFVLQAKSWAQLLKFEFLQYKEYVWRDDRRRTAILTRYKNDGYNHAKSWFYYDTIDIRRDTFEKYVVNAAILACSNNRTNDFNELKYEEKRNLRKETQRIINEIDDW